MLGVDNSQSARTHRRVFAGAHDRIGHITAVQNTLDQAADGDFGVGPADRNGNPAHVTRPWFLGRWPFRLS